MAHSWPGFSASNCCRIYICGITTQHSTSTTVAAPWLQCVLGPPLSCRRIGTAMASFTIRWRHNRTIKRGLRATAVPTKTTARSKRPAATRTNTSQLALPIVRPQSPQRRPCFRCQFVASCAMSKLRCVHRARCARWMPSRQVRVGRRPAVLSTFRSTIIFFVVTTHIRVQLRDAVHASRGDR